MSKNIDLEKPLSDEDRAWLKDHALGYQIEENDRKFGKEKEYEPPSLAAQEPYEEGKRPEPVFAQRPFDPQIEGYFAGGVIVPGESVIEVGEEETDIEYLTVEELKEELHARDLSTSGNKNALVDRLKEALKKE